ncbi:MAG: hypothetical protein NC341_00785 [Blautia sp.]|nr:hypothetical protein [Blautia sp.]MCM1202160.1 hypothetical protein [Bacteroides fragilis]
MNLYKKIIRKLKPDDPDLYVDYLREKGVRLGKGCRIFDPRHTHIDLQNPHMLELGDNVRITSGVHILTHDYSWSVLAGVYGEILGGGWKRKNRG